MAATNTSAPIQRRQLLLDRLTGLLRANPIIRRWWDARPANAITNSTPQPPPAPPSPPQPQQQPEKQPQTTHNESEQADADAPVALLLPGMAELTISAGRDPIPEHTTQPQPQPFDPEKHAFDLLPKKPLFTHKPPSQPDLFLTMLPFEIHSAIFETSQLSLHDLVSLRNTCRTLRRNLPIGVMERKLRVQNFAGWDVVFEMHGHRYPGTTYGNRRLCGRCVIPKIRGHLIEGAAVRGYLARRKGERVLRLAEEDVEWPDERAMCFPCLWNILVSAAGQEVTVGMEIFKVAAISTKERFRMIDGTDRKMCERCARDIHENAVPCPHCTDFSEWCKTRWQRT